ncbi:MAG: hypothetical protein AAF755_05715 [Pseudomonadota bacterium]
MKMPQSMLSPRSGLSRRLMQFALTVTLTVFTGAAFASEATLSSDTAEICAQYRGFEDASLETALRSAGWTRLTSAPEQTLKNTFRDGMMISTGVSNARRIDWSDAQSRAERTTDTIIQLAADESILRLYASANEPRAVLSVFLRPLEEVDLFQCNYSGPISDQHARILQQVRKMDENAGKSIVNPEFYVMKRRSMQPFENGQGMKEVSLQMSQYLIAMSDVIGRNASAEMGFSQVTVYPK